jgi:hypothetical protein
MLQSFQQLVTIADYYVDQAAYAKNCINKYRPKLNCNGQCQLMKKLEKQEKESQPELKLSLKQDVISSRHFYPTLSPPLTSNPLLHVAYYQASLSDQPRLFFHPPAWV